MADSMKTSLKIVLKTLAAILLTVLSALAVLLLVSDDTRKDWLVAGASYAMNREVEINGEFILKFGSSVVVHAAEVSVANTEWGVHPVLFQAQKLDASLPLWPLLKGRLEFNLSLSAPELMLETGGTGIGNWNLDEAVEASNHLHLPLKIVPREISISDARFLYREYAVEQQDEAEIERFYLAVLKDQRVLELVGHFNELPLSLKSEQLVGEEVETEVATQLSVNGQIGRLSIQADGTVKGSVELGDPELDLAIAFESPSLRIVSGQLGQRLPDLGPLEGKARLHGPISAPSLKEIAATLDSAKGKLKVSGAIGDAIEMSGFDLQVNAETHNLVELLKVFSVDFPLALPYKMQAEANLSGDWPALMLGDIKAKATDGLFNAVMNGQISSLLDLDGVDFRGKLDAPTLADLPTPQELKENRLPKIGPVKGAVHITAKDGVWSASEARIDIENKNGWLRFRAEIANLAEWRGLDSELQAKLPSLENLQLELRPGVAELGSVEISATLKAEPAGSDQLVFRGKATSGKLSVIATGNIGEVFIEDGIALELELTAEQLSDLGKLLGRKLPEVGPVRYNGKLVIKEDIVKLEQFEARAGNSDLAGQLAFSIAGRSGHDEEILGGRLTSNILDLGELLPEREAVEVTVLENQKMVEDSVDPDTPSAKRFSTESLPLEQLRQFRTQVELEVGKLITRQGVLENLKTVFTLVDSVLTIKPFLSQVGGKPVELEMTLDASKSPAAFKLSVHAEDIDIIRAYQSVSRLGLEGGEMSFYVDINGEGDSIAAIMASMDGTAAFGIVDSRLSDVSANKFGVSLLNQINPVREKGDPNILECGAVYFEIEDGVATTPRGLAAQFEQVTWLGNGDINLANERIHISVRPKARKGLGVSLNQLAKLVLLGGTLSHPVVQLNPVGVIGASANYAAAISTGGLSLLLVGLVEKSQANERVCLQIMDPKMEDNASATKVLKSTTRIPQPRPSKNTSTTNELLDGD